MTTAAQAGDMRVQVEGLSKPLKANVLASLDWKGIDTEKLSESYLHRRLEQSEALVHQALEPFGHYNATVDSQLKPSDKGWQASYNISAGPLTHVSDLSVTFTGDAAESEFFSTASSTFPLQPGDALLHSQYESGKSAISKQLLARGYLDAKLTRAKVTVDKANNTASIALSWRSGKPYSFGTLSSNSTYIDERLISRWARFQQGDRFSYPTLLAFQRRLDSSGFFQSSEVAVNRQPKTGVADIAVTTEPASKRLYRGSLGYGTDTGARMQLGFEQRWLNHYGHSLRSDMRLAEREQSYSIKYHVPALHGRADSYDYGWQRREQQLPEYETRSDRLSAVQLSQTDHWQILWGINLEHDNFIIGTTRQSDTLWYLENQWSRYRSKQAVYPSHADSLIINGRLGAGFDSQQKYFSRLHLQQRWIRPAPWPGRFLIRAAAGALWSDSFDRLPPQHRFYSGGDRNVRGYSYQSLSPVDASNTRVGGRYLVELSTEIDYRLSPSWAVAAFADAGQAFNSSSPDIAVGTGFGFRFITSVLVIRIDIANAINQTDKPWRLHLSLGTDF